MQDGTWNLKNGFTTQEHKTTTGTKEGAWFCGAPATLPISSTHLFSSCDVRTNLPLLSEQIVGDIYDSFQN